MKNLPEILWAADNQIPYEDDCACASVSGPHILHSSAKDATTEEDCACVENSSRPLSSLNDCACSASHQRMSSLIEIPMKDATVAIFNPKGPQNAVVINDFTRQILNAFQKPASIQEAVKQVPEVEFSVAVKTALQLSRLGLLVVEEDCGPAQRPPATLTSWLHLTDRCNLRCDYCYLPHVREDMSFETGRAAIDATFRSALANGFRQVKLKYAGGEPLLRFPLILELHGYAQQLADEHGLSLEEVALSNGTLLTAEMVETLKALGIRLMISLDGFGAYHDSHRPYAGGRGSFADVAEAIDLTLVHGLTPNISVTVSSRTAEGLPEITLWILERELPFSLNFYRENELSASHEDMRLDEQKIINGMLAAFKVIEDNLPRRSFLGGIIDRANLSASHTHTCGVGQNYLVFDQNGQVAKCQMRIRKPITDVHAADPLAVIRADQVGIKNISVEEKEGCKTCEWKHWCAGGCPLATYRATGRYDVKSPNCNIYKALFPEALRLEGLRLLKYQDDPEVVMKI